MLQSFSSSDDCLLVVRLSVQMKPVVSPRVLLARSLGKLSPKLSANQFLWCRKSGSKKEEGKGKKEKANKYMTTIAFISLFSGNRNSNWAVSFQFPFQNNVLLTSSSPAASYNSEFNSLTYHGVVTLRQTGKLISTCQYLSSDPFSQKLEVLFVYIFLPPSPTPLGMLILMPNHHAR